ncbi:hypothetical protein [Jatrophihabitans sp.]|uniref:hypothetical protein n=1 Tax=Jatrophihabitans sp. TaxID=1932789 RepID=UPI0030C7431D
MTEPFGAIGASHLIQLAVTAFYDAVPSRRNGSLRDNDARAIYPEIYLFHVGGAFGDHGSFDFWPARKEIFLPAEARLVLDAVNDRGITRLAVPDGIPRSVEHEWKEPAAANDRISTVLVYGADGHVVDPTWQIAGLTPATESNVRRVLDPERRYASGPAEPDYPQDALLQSRHWRTRTELRRSEAAEGLAVAQLRRDLLRDARGLAVEEYRTASVDEALALLV